MTTSAHPIADLPFAPRHLHDPSLRYFHEVARLGSVSAAAQQLHVAASAISRQVARLEATLGTPLFERHARGMVLTAEGELLAAHARRMLLDSEKVVQEILALRGLRAGRVRIVASEAFANDFLPPLIADFQRRHQGVVFELNSAPPKAVSTLVRSGEADIGIKFSQGLDADVHVQVRQSAPSAAVMRPDHSLARHAQLSLHDLKGHDLALPTADTNLRQMFDAACSHEQLRLAPVFLSSNPVALHNFVLASHGVAVSSPYSARAMMQAGLLVAVPLRHPVLALRHLEVQTLAGRALPRAVAAFLDDLGRHMGDG